MSFNPTHCSTHDAMLKSQEYMSVVVVETCSSHGSSRDRASATLDNSCHKPVASVPNAHSSHDTIRPRKFNQPVAPGYVREQIPRLSCFISLLVFHVWTSNTLSQTLDVRNRNHFLITFVKNILEITRIPLPVVTLAVKYIQRLRRLRGHKAYALPGDETRVFSVALILAQKYSDDTPYGNRMWGKVLGLSSRELTRLEINFLGEIGYNLYVPEQEYSSFCRGVQALAREWNASLLSREEVQSGSDSKTYYPSLPHHHQPMRIDTSMMNRGTQLKSSLQTPTSSTESLVSCPEEAVGHSSKSQEASPPTLIEKCDDSSLSSSFKMPNVSTQKEATPVFLAFPCSNNVSVVSTPTPATLESFLENASKTYGLVPISASLGSVGLSPSILPSTHAKPKIALSPIPVANVVHHPSFSSTAGSSMQYYLVSATSPFVLLPRPGDLSKQYIQIMTARSRSVSRATSPIEGEGATEYDRSSKRVKYI
ncbi:hypothetical protein BDR26DRAFT_1004141 [Obelidium mucronatum]|nr:hypothetical protein BDR26DRAFT_1004141 [Obelidium mucronatum]